MLLPHKIKIKALHIQWDRKQQLSNALHRQQVMSNSLQQGRQATVRTMTGTFKVKALGPTVELAELPLAKARRPIATALLSLAREAVAAPA